MMPHFSLVISPLEAIRLLEDTKMPPHGELPSPLPRDYHPCAWCLKAQGIEPDPNQSHGICPAHADDMRREIAEMKERM